MTYRIRSCLRFIFVVCFILAAGGLRSAIAGPLTITISAVGGVAISPYLYGINYDWDKVPQSEFQSFAANLARVSHYTLVRYPGGWNAESYNWNNNIESGKRAPQQAGVSPSVLLGSVPAASFITPSERAISDPGKINHVVKQSVRLVTEYAGTVHYWEIGNEWWLQTGAKKDPNKREANLQNYATLLAAVVPAMKSANPSIEIFATVDWTNLSDISTLRNLTGPAVWAQIDGISVHPYCGTTAPDRLCSSLPTQLAAVRAASGKNIIYASEWAVAKQLSSNDYGIKNAGYTVTAIQDLAFSGVTLGAYWPPVKVLPTLAFVSADYATPFATGLVFGWMAQYYEGTALHTGGPLPAVAANNGNSTTVIVVGGDDPSQNVQVALAGTQLHRVISASVMFSAAPDDPQNSRLVTIVPLPTSIITNADGSSYVQFMLNPGTPGRGNSFEIARVTLG